MYDPASASDVTLKPFPDAQAPKVSKKVDMQLTCNRYIY